MSKGKEMKAVVSIGGLVDPSLNKSISQAVASTRGMSAAMAGALGQAGNDIKKLDALFGGVEKAAKAALGAVAVGAGAAAVGIGASIKVGAAFEAQMSTVEAISGASALEMQSLSDAALELGASTQFTASEVGQALEYMGMAGWKTEDMLAGLDGVVALAAASGEDLATVSDIVTDDLTAFGMSAEETGRMVDVMAAAATNANTNIAMMGETFKYAAPVAATMGYSLEDVAVATGLMANSGIKASQAGTTLRSWISRMASPTKQVSEAMSALGLSLKDDEGNMKSFAELIGDTRTAMQGLSEDEQAHYATMIAGKTAMSGMLAVVNASAEDYNKLAAAIENSEGAAQKMADIRMDNLQGDTAKFKSALEGLGVAIYEEVKNPARNVMQSLTGFIDSLRDKLPKAIAEVVRKLPSIKREFDRIAKPIFEVAKSGIQWVIDHKNGVIGAIAGVGAALVSYKIGRKVADIATAVGSFVATMGPVGGIILGVTAAIGTVTAAVVAYKRHEQELIDNNLAEHFGNISLSMQEIERTADNIIRTDALTTAEKVLSIAEEAETLLDQITNDRGVTDEMNWKVRVGIELDETDEETYKESISAFIEDAQAYVEKNHYAVDVAMDLTFPRFGGKNQTIRSSVGDAYSDIEEALEAEGKYLQEVVNAAFSDGLLDINETEAITNIQNDMARIAVLTAGAEQKAALHEMSVRYGVELDPESAQNLRDELMTRAMEAADTYNEAYSKELTALYVSRDAGKLTDTQFEDALAALDKSKLDNTAKAYSDSLAYVTDTALEAYGNVLGDDFEKVRKKLEETLLKIDPEEIKNGADMQHYIDIFHEVMSDIPYTPDPRAREAILNYIGVGAPTEEEINQIAEDYVKTGQKIPEEIADRLLDYAALEGMNSGQSELPRALVELLVSGMIEQSENQGDKLDEVGRNFDQAAADGIEKNGVIVESAAAKIAMQTTQKLGEEFQKPIDLDANVNLNVHVMGVNSGEIRSALDGIKTGHEYSAGGAGHYAYADGGFTHGLSIAGEEGTEAVISFNSDVRQRNINIWKRAGEILGVQQSTTSSVADEERVTTSGGNNITFSPNITINGSADKDTVISALRKSFAEFMDLLEENGVIPHNGTEFAYG